MPLLASCPDLFKGGQDISQLVQNIDIAPTVLAAGLRALASLPGRSLLPLLQNPALAWRDRIYYEYYWEYDFPMTPPVFGVRTDRDKYIRYYGIWDTNELYDLLPARTKPPTSSTGPSTPQQPRAWPTTCSTNWSAPTAWPFRASARSSSRLATTATPRSTS